MNKEDIIMLLKEADVWVADQEPYQSQLERFANLLVEKTTTEVREQCAVLAWSTGMDIHNEHNGLPVDAREVGSKIALKIRETVMTNNIK